MKRLILSTFVLLFLFLRALWAQIPHDPLLWHPHQDPVTGLCYDHEHGDDPSELDWIFGPVGAWHGQGYEVGSAIFPQEKHTGFLWITTGPDLIPLNYIVPYHQDDVYLAAFRMQAHFLNTVGAQSKRYHSIEVEAYICTVADQRCGIFRYAGVMDTGALRLGTISPTVKVLFPDGSVPRNNEKRETFWCGTSGEAASTWYSVVLLPRRYVPRRGELLRVGNIAPLLETGGEFKQGMSCYTLIDPNNIDYSGRLPTTPFDNVVLHPLSGDNNTNSFHGLVFNIAPYADTDALSFVNPITGRMDADCTELGPDCALLSLEGLPPEWESSSFQLRRDALIRKMGYTGLPDRQRSSQECIDAGFPIVR
jgi:hypothetical protein